MVVLDLLDIHPLIDIAIQHPAYQIDAALAEGQVGDAQGVIQDLICLPRTPLVSK